MSLLCKLSDQDWEELEEIVADVSVEAGNTVMKYYKGAKGIGAGYAEATQADVAATETILNEIHKRLASFLLRHNCDVRYGGEELFKLSESKTSQNEREAIEQMIARLNIPVDKICKSYEEFRQSLNHCHLSVLFDPLDGTLPFRAELPFFTCAIAIFIGCKPVVSAIYLPIEKRVYYASIRKDRASAKVKDVSSGSVACLDEERKRIINERGENKQIAYQITRSKVDRRYEALIKFPLFQMKFGNIYMFNAGQYSMVQVARGSLDAFINNYTYAWDVAPGQVLIKAVGGEVTGTDGEPIDYCDGSRIGVIASGNVKLHKELIKCWNIFDEGCYTGAGSNTQELFVLVEKDTSTGKIEFCGTVTRDSAHRFGLPHTSVLLIPIKCDPINLEPLIVMHLRSPYKRISPNTWDFCGGHVTFCESYFCGAPWDSTYDLERASDDTAVREANEELKCVPPYTFTSKDIRRFKSIGFFECKGLNTEYSTAYVVKIPKDRTVEIWDTDRQAPSGRKLTLKEFTLSALMAEFAKDPSSFADGAGRILSRLSSDPNLMNELIKIMRCMCTP